MPSMREVLAKHKAAKVSPIQTVPKPASVVVATAIRSCGHIEEFPDKPGEKPEHKEGRLKKFNGKKCLACRAQAQKELEAAQQAARAAKIASGQQKSKPRKFKTCDVCLEKQPTYRLPHGAGYTARWNSGTQLWTGTLAVGSERIEGSAGGLFALLRQLDKQFRGVPEPTE